MTSHALGFALRRARRHTLSRRHVKPVEFEGKLLSVAGAVGSPVYSGSGERLGDLDDIVVRWDSGDEHPPLYGALVHAHRSLAFVPATAIAAVLPDQLRLHGSLEPGAPERHPGLVALARDVLDRQIVDVDGADVDRVSDLVLGRGPDGIRLVGADVSLRTLLRRLGPARMRRMVATERVYDWASVAAFSVHGAGEAGSVLKLTDAASHLRALDPTQIASLLDDLPPPERDQLSSHLAEDSEQ